MDKKITVKNANQLDTPQGKVLVAKGKLLLLDSNNPFPGRMVSAQGKVSKLKPVIVSPDERIDLEDLFVFQKSLYICDGVRYDVLLAEGEDMEIPASKSYKVLATPDQFSQIHLQFIADKIISPGKEVYIKCAEKYMNAMGIAESQMFKNAGQPYPEWADSLWYEYKIHLDNNDEITLIVYNRL